MLERLQSLERLTVFDRCDKSDSNSKDTHDEAHMKGLESQYSLCSEGSVIASETISTKGLV